MGGSNGNLNGLVQSFLLAAFFGLVGTVVMGMLGNMGWAAAGGLGAALAGLLALFFAVVLGGPTQQIGSAPQSPVVAQAVATPAMATPLMASPLMAPVAAMVPALDDAAVAAAGAGVKPAGMSAPRHGKADDLKHIEGIGPVLEKLCHEMGIYHFDQIAGWGAGEVAWMNGNLKGFKGRVGRDKWVAQARLIGSVGMDEFKRRAETNDY